MAPSLSALAALRGMAMAVGQPRREASQQVTHLATWCPSRRLGVAHCTLLGSTDTPAAESQWPRRPSACRPKSHSNGAFGVELPEAEDPEHLRVRLGDVRAHARRWL